LRLWAQLFPGVNLCLIYSRDKNKPVSLFCPINTNSISELALNNFRIFEFRQGIKIRHNLSRSLAGANVLLSFYNEAELKGNPPLIPSLPSRCGTGSFSKGDEEQQTYILFD
jgi:hypothetical protein